MTVRCMDCHQEFDAPMVPTHGCVMPGRAKLSPCPFCGNDEALIARTHTEVADPKRGWPTAIHCPACGADGPIWTRVFQPPEVERAWNERGAVRTLGGFRIVVDDTQPDGVVIFRDHRGRVLANAVFDPKADEWRVLLP